MTRFEEAKVIGLRANQIAAGDPPKVPLDLDRYYSVNDVARLEYEAGVLPYTIQRTLPTGQSEQWKISDMRPAK